MKWIISQPEYGEVLSTIAILEVHHALSGDTRKAASDLLKRLRSLPELPAEETAFVSFLGELARATGVLPDYADLTNNGHIIRHFAKLTNPAPAEPETCEPIENCWECPLNGGGDWDPENCMASVDANDGLDGEFIPGPCCPFLVTIKPGRE